MAKIFVLMGKSASGKDTLYKELMADKQLRMKKVVPYTTRPIRAGEAEGREYHFVSEQKLDELMASELVIECRVYQTIHGPWHYFTVEDGQIDLKGADHYLLINTLEGYRQLAEYYGLEQVVPLYVEVEDGLRLSRAVERERRQENPKYEELCRRFLADAGDFSDEKLAEAGIFERYENSDRKLCQQKLAERILVFSERV